MPFAALAHSRDAADRAGAAASSVGLRRSSCRAHHGSGGEAVLTVMPTGPARPRDCHERVGAASTRGCSLEYSPGERLIALRDGAACHGLGELELNE